MTPRRAFVAALTAFGCALLPLAVGAVDRAAGAGVPKPAIAGQPWSSEAKARLDRDIDTLLAAAPTLHGAHVGLLALDTRSGDVVYARNADDAFVPASTFKLLTGSVALATLGPAYRFRTAAYVDAASRSLVIRTGGDPLLSVKDLDAMSQAVRAAGIVALPLGVRIDATAFDSAPYPPGWAWDDFAYDYSPVLSAAAIEENVLHLTVGPGAAPGLPVRVQAAPPFDQIGAARAECSSTDAIHIVALATTSAAGSPGAIDIVRDPRGCIEVVGSLPADAAAQAIDAAVPSPISYFGQLALYALRLAGVDANPSESVAGSPAAQDAAQRVPDDARAIWTHDGEPLGDLLADMWWPSDNFVAEQLLKAVGVRSAGTPGTVEHGAAAERVWLASIGVDPATLTIADGSGLSAYDRITPRALTAILQADWNGPYRDIVLDDLPLAGVRGTLEHSFTGTLAQGRTFAKTGSVMHARGVAGYLATLHHGALTFAWSVDDWMGVNDDLADLRARVLARMIGD